MNLYFSTLSSRFWIQFSFVDFSLLTLPFIIWEVLEGCLSTCHSLWEMRPNWDSYNFDQSMYSIIKSYIGKVNLKLFFFWKNTNTLIKFSFRDKVMCTFYWHSSVFLRCLSNFLWVFSKNLFLIFYSFKKFQKWLRFSIFSYFHLSIKVKN